MGSKTRLSSYCTKRANNGVNLVTSRKINTRLARPIVVSTVLNSCSEAMIDEVYIVELAWRNGSVMDCHATARGSSQGTVNWGAVS